MGIFRPKSLDPCDFYVGIVKTGDRGGGEGLEGVL